MVKLNMMTTFNLRNHSKFMPMYLITFSLKLGLNIHKGIIIGKPRGNLECGSAQSRVFVNTNDQFINT